MNYTSEYLIQKRKERWEKSNNIEDDRIFTEAVSIEIVSNEYLLKEIKDNPEYLIELIFCVVDKKQKTVPFFLNDVQKEFLSIVKESIYKYKNGLITDLTFLVLKGRQQGFTTLITAYQLAKAILTRNFQGFTLADCSENTEAIFQNKAKFVYDKIPDILKPTEKYNNRRQLLFSKINSNWSVSSATDNVGRSKTINFFHGSECAFWKSLSNILAGLGEAFTLDCIKIYESTANGYNDFQKMWESGEHINCFFEWWKTKEYRINFESERIKQEFVNNIYNIDNWIFSRCKWLLKEKKLELEQIYWYYKKFLTQIDKEKLKQEYPCFPDEAFLTSGKCYLNRENIINRLKDLKIPLKKGRFEYEYTESKIWNIKWLEDKENGIIDIYENPQLTTPYVLSGDTAGDGSDYFTGQMINNKTGKQVAKLRLQFDEDEYTRQMFCLGKYFNYAFIGIEANYSTYPIKKLYEYGYENQYVREQEDTIKDKLLSKFGFKTTQVTRPLILAMLQAIFNDHIDWINDRDTLNEALVFIRNPNKNGRPEAQEGSHDDLIMALAIVYYIRTQQKIEKPQEKAIKKNYNFDIERQKDNSNQIDYGDSIEII